MFDTYEAGVRPGSSPLPEYTNAEDYTRARCRAGRNAEMVGYFGFHSDDASIFSIQPGRANNIVMLYRGSGVPTITAPADHTGGIILRRYGSMVIGTLQLDFGATENRSFEVDNAYIEYLIVLKQKPIAMLGTTGSLVLSGAGSDGLMVTCTMSDEMGIQYKLGNVKYDMDYVCQIVIRNPVPYGGSGNEGSTVRGLVPITLAGVIPNA
jgi:hypothetical protein